MRRAEQSDAPVQKTSSYAAEFPNWKNGLKDVYHEKHPQFPYYSLPFKGDSSYKKNFTDEQMKMLRKHHEMMNQMAMTSSTIK